MTTRTRAKSVVQKYTNLGALAYDIGGGWLQVQFNDMSKDSGYMWQVMSRKDFRLKKPPTKPYNRFPEKYVRRRIAGDIKLITYDESVRTLPREAYSVGLGVLIP